MKNHQSGTPAWNKLALTIVGVLLLLFGVFYGVGGVYLFRVGGTAYFALMGGVMLISAVLVFRRKPAGALLYGLGFIGSIAWAVADAGWEFWPLFSRLFALGVLALFVALVYPLLLRASGRARVGAGSILLALVLAVGLVLAVVSAFFPKSVIAPTQTAIADPLPPGSTPKNWEHWGNTTSGTRFVAADQITKQNIGQLEVAWTAHTGDIPQSKGSGAEDQNTPLQIGDTLYVCTAYGKVLALDADTGAQRWKYDSKGNAPNWQRCRGLGYYDFDAPGADATPATGVAPIGAGAAPAAAMAPSQPASAGASPAAAANAQSATASAAPATAGASAASAGTSPAAVPQAAGTSAASAAAGAGTTSGAAVSAAATPAASGITPASQTAATAASAAACRKRLFLPTIDARLIAIDAQTGLPCEEFGEHGTVDLKVGMGEIKPGYYQQTSTPLVAGELVVVGGRVADNFSTGEPPGVVRAYSVRTGELMWAWDPGNPNITKLPPPGGTYTRGTPNVWSAMAYDPKLGLIYLPTGNATPDFWAGERTALDDKYSSSVVALEARSGQVRWTFQTTHHDLWDFDLPAQPLLYDIPDGHGQTTPALAQVSKQGEIFLLNRITGQPLAEVQERPVPQGKVPGERYSPTQPYSVGMPSIGNATLTESDMWGATPFDLMMCRIQFKEMRHEGVYTPPGMDRALQFPGSLGGMNWGSVSVDPTTSYMFVNDMRIGLANYMIPRAQINPNASGIEMGVVPQAGTPYGAMRDRFLSKLGIPCQKPPYGTMSAIDLKTRKLVWQVPVGTVQDTGPLGIKMRMPIPIGMPTLGGSLATASGLLFFSGTQDYYLRAFDSGTGSEIWKVRLPVGSQSGPMSYVSPRTGRQYVLVTAGGARVSPDRGDYVIAYALPNR